MTETRSPHFNRDSTASTYRDVHLPRVFAPWAEVLLELVPARPGEAVLDVATGPGTVARLAAARVGPNGRVCGVDISGAMLAIGRGWAAASGAAPIEYVEASATAMPVPDGVFDLAYCQQGLQHMSDAPAALREMRRALKSGGRLGVATWEQSPFGLFREVVANMGLSGDGPRPSSFGRDPDELAGALREAGFEVVDVHRREMVSVLEGGIAQALDVAVATSAGAALNSLPAAQQQTVRAALSHALEPYVRDGAVYLPSVSNIASAVAGHRGRPTGG